jgi:hypothetical protein
MKRWILSALCRRAILLSACSQPLNPLLDFANMIEELLVELSQAIQERRYDEAEQIGLQMLDHSPSEEADRCIHDIISSATTIRDAEDEIRYQLEDLKAALKLEPESTGEDKEVDGL